MDLRCGQSLTGRAGEHLTLRKFIFTTIISELRPVSGTHDLRRLRVTSFEYRTEEQTILNDEVLIHLSFAYSARLVFIVDEEPNHFYIHLFPVLLFGILLASHTIARHMCAAVFFYKHRTR